MPDVISVISVPLAFTDADVRSPEWPAIKRALLDHSRAAIDYAIDERVKYLGLVPTVLAVPACECGARGNEACRFGCTAMRRKG